jgi:hypothetical protein
MEDGQLKKRGLIFMGIDQRIENRRMAQVVEERAGVGPTEIVSGWQTVLVDLLSRMKLFMRPGVMVTFRHLTTSEIALFEGLHHKVRIPQSAAAI